jgi:hypothetical protein
MKYWYVAFAVVVIIMLLNFYNNNSVYKFQLTIFDKNGNVVEQNIIHKEQIEMVDSIRAPKAVMPIKKF